MLNPMGRVLLSAALMSCLALVACHDSAPEPAAKPASATEKPKTPKAALDVNMVAAVAPESTTRVVGMHFVLTRTPVINEGLPIDIARVPHQEFSSVSAHFFGQDGLTLVSGDALGPVTDAKPEKAITHQVVLMPTRDGVYMLSATVDTTGSDGMVSRVFSIPIVVSSRATVPPAEAAPATPPAPSAPPTK